MRRSKCVTVCPAGALTKGWHQRRHRLERGEVRRLPAVHGWLRLRRHRPRRGTGHVAKCDTLRRRSGLRASLSARCADLHNDFAHLQRSRRLGGPVRPGLAGCQGCNTELLMRHTLRRVGPDTVLATPPGCVAGHGLGRLQRHHRHQDPCFSSAPDQHGRHAGRHQAAVQNASAAKSMRWPLPAMAALGRRFSVTVWCCRTQ